MLLRRVNRSFFSMISLSFRNRPVSQPANHVQPRASQLSLRDAYFLGWQCTSGEFSEYRVLFLPRAIRGAFCAHQVRATVDIVNSRVGLVEHLHDVGLD